eukprot:CAMPEP_0204596126 /NCGR_PEP_ID=MMETSP0661-20131031/53066_1 /ASSEMBLY_ACC=CAM_ASM_000606 /TAXON_ID=109239 /ORGANISM="Alexandrium margalefi, Strain AMGDE01CS-322" /LENGTH=30 /DNA_ID= /DNA_START= /DNA_END= /DNA_ORIENTATION=
MAHVASHNCPGGLASRNETNPLHVRMRKLR